MTRTPTKTLAKTLVCKRCGNRQVIQRRLRHDRPPGHIKTLWCFRCQLVTDHIEQAA